jgi:hypothetical protein
MRLSNVVYQRAEIQALFDKQIAGIMKKIDSQLNWMQGARPSDQVVSFVISYSRRVFSADSQLRGTLFSQAGSEVQLI